MQIGSRIAAWCNLLGVDQAELARRLSRHPSTVSRWFKNQTVPTGRNLEKVAEALGLTMAQFYGAISSASAVAG